MKVVIIHGSNAKEQEKLAKGYYQQNNRGWIPWVREELREKGIECITPLMPESWAPVYEKWKKDFEEINIYEEDILIGTSARGAFLTKWLGETNKKIKKLILVAPAIINVKREIWELDRFYDFKINKNLHKKVREIVLFESTNDSEGILKAGKIYSKELGVKPIILENKGHFTEKGMGTNEFPELLEEVLKTK